MTTGGPLRIVAWFTWSGRERSSQSRSPQVPQIRLAFFLFSSPHTFRLPRFRRRYRRDHPPHSLVSRQNHHMCRNVLPFSGLLIIKTVVFLPRSARSCVQAVGLEF